jgi:ABC-type hemin transport system substrate-binding protein
VLVDDAGERVRFGAPPGRIVSLNPTTTELLFALGAGPRLVGRSSACDHPAGAAAVPSVGGGFPPAVEAVVGTRPDLVVLYHSAGNPAAAARLRELGIRVLRLRTDRLRDVALLAGSELPGLEGRPEWRVLPAVRAGRLLRLTESSSNRPSPRAPAAARALRARLAALTSDSMSGVLR